MNKKTPNKLEHMLVKTWSERKCLRQLRLNAISGNVDWVKLLLHETNYRTYPLILKRDWWFRDTSSEEQTDQRSKVARSMVRKLLDTLAIDDMPKDVAKHIPITGADKNIAILKLWPQYGKKVMR